MFKKKSFSLTLVLSLSTAVNFYCYDVHGMDSNNEMLMEVKKEPQHITSQSVAKPLISIKDMQNIFRHEAGQTKARIENFINPKKGKKNCVPCAISYYDWINTQSEKPTQVKSDTSPGINIRCEDKYSELIKITDNKKLYPKTVEIDLETGEVKTKIVEKNPIFNAVVITTEGDYPILKDYLNAVPTKTLQNSPHGFRVGLVYLINQKDTSTGHMVNFYKCIENNVAKNYIIDPQNGEINILENFLKNASKKYLNYIYVWYDQTENPYPFEARNNFIDLVKQENLLLSNGPSSNINNEYDKESNNNKIWINKDSDNNIHSFGASDSSDTDSDSDSFDADIERSIPPFIISNVQQDSPQINCQFERGKDYINKNSFNEGMRQLNLASQKGHQEATFLCGKYLSEFNNHRINSKNKFIYHPKYNQKLLNSETYLTVEEYFTKAWNLGYDNIEEYPKEYIKGHLLGIIKSQPADKRFEFGKKCIFFKPRTMIDYDSSKMYTKIGYDFLNSASQDGHPEAAFLCGNYIHQLDSAKKGYYSQHFSYSTASTKDYSTAQEYFTKAWDLGYRNIEEYPTEYHDQLLMKQDNALSNSEIREEDTNIDHSTLELNINIEIENKNQNAILPKEIIITEKDLEIYNDYKTNKLNTKEIKEKYSEKRDTKIYSGYIGRLVKKIDLKDKIEALEIRIKLNDKDDDAHYELGKIYTEFKSTKVQGLSCLTTAQNLGNKNAAFLRGDVYSKDKNGAKASTKAYLKAWELGYKPIEAYPEDIHGLIKNAQQAQSDEPAQQVKIGTNEEGISKKRSLSESTDSDKDSSNDTENVKKPRIEINNQFAQQSQINMDVEIPSKKRSLSESTDSEKESSKDTENAKNANTEKSQVRKNLYLSTEDILPKPYRTNNSAIPTNNNINSNNQPRLEITKTPDSQPVIQPQLQRKETLTLDLTTEEEQISATENKSNERPYSPIVFNTIGSNLSILPPYPIQNNTQINSYYSKSNAGTNNFNLLQLQPSPSTDQLLLQQPSSGIPNPFNWSEEHESLLNSSLTKQQKEFEKIIKDKDVVIQRKDYLIKEKEFFIKEKDLKIQDLLNRLAVYESGSK